MTSGLPLHAAIYLRVSTARQAEHDVSIPDQRKQGESYCASRGYQLVETYVEPGASATNDRRPEFQKMMEAGTASLPPLTWWSSIPSAGSSATISSWNSTSGSWRKTASVLFP